MLESYFLNVQKANNGVWISFIPPRVMEFQESFSDVVTYKQIKTIHRRNLLRETSSCLRKPGSGAQRKRACCTRNIPSRAKTSIMHLPGQVELSDGACHQHLRKNYICIHIVSIAFINCDQ